MPDATPSNTTIQKLITPHDQFIRTVFNTQRSYFIDIYQREYKWTDERNPNQQYEKDAPRYHACPFSKS